MATSINESGWNFDYDLMEGGLILRDVRHHSFSLARDIRLTRVWVDTELPLKTIGRSLVNFKLNSAELPVTGQAEIINDSSITNKPVSPSAYFSGYRNPFGLMASYQSRDKYLSGTANECSLAFTQKFLFGNYGKDPAHEPGDVLEATRIFPLLSFLFPAVKNPAQPYPKYFRADYRLDVSIDNIDESQVALGKPGSDTTLNKAAIFRDSEGLPGPGALLGKWGSGPSVGDIFAALEKPLPLEIASHALVKGPEPLGVTPLDTWDNVHMWAAKRGGVENPISTPGAFHALHCHWRWGAVAGDPDPGTMARLLLPAGGKTFGGLGWSKSAGGALVDAAIPGQNVRFAFTRNDSAWAAEKNPSERDFNSLFSDVRKVPADVKEGDDLIFWVSYEVFRNEEKLSEPWGGTVFVNGCYFAHNADNTPLKVRVAGAYGEEVRPRLTNKWERLARG